MNEKHAVHDQRLAYTGEDAALLILQEYINTDRDIPLPRRSRKSGTVRQIHLPALPTAKLELYRAFRESGIRKSELARRLKIAKTNVDRLFDLRHQSRLDHIEAGFAALSKRLLLSVTAA
jgi:antitoxin HicB